MTVLTPAQVLAMIPQQRPMRFIENILEIDEEHIVGTYTWKPEDCAGYSADGLVVPPFKLIEMSAQVGSVAWCIYQMSLRIPVEEVRQLIGFFTQLEQGVFVHPVRTGETVACQGTFDGEGYFRTNKILSRVEMQVMGGPRDGLAVFSGLISGVWVPKGSSSPR